MKNILLIISALLIASQAADTSLQLDYVFEVVRHGARAPLLAQLEDKFPVGAGMLSPMGMRQRYFLGGQNYKDFIETQGLLDEGQSLLDGAVYIQSTDVLRTIQSGNSEMLGLFENVDTSSYMELSSEEKLYLKGSSYEMPLSARNFDTLNTELGNQAIYPGFVPQPVYTEIEAIPFDNQNYYACNFEREAFTNLGHNDTHFAPWLHYIDDHIAFAQETLELTDEQAASCDWHDWYNYADGLFSLNFEDTDAVTFPDAQTEYDVNHTQKVYLQYTFGELSRNNMQTKEFYYPFAYMNNTVNCTIDSSASDCDQKMSLVKYYIISGHDTNIVNILEWMAHDIADYQYVKYAEQIYFMLYEDSACLADSSTTDKHSCFHVKVSHDKQKGFKLNNCASYDDTTETCSLDDFFSYMTSISVPYDQTTDVCNMVWTPEADSIRDPQPDPSRYNFYKDLFLN